MKGIKAHTHEDRTRVIEEMIPLVRKEFGDNLIGLAAQGSYARGEDGPYSDLELIAFLKKKPKGEMVSGMAKIRDGMLVELLWTTREKYLQSTIDVNADWYLSGSDVLLPVINKEYIRNIGTYQSKRVKENCLKHAAERFYELQESTTKLLNAIEDDNLENTGLVAFDMFMNMLVVLSFLNQTPYTTLSRFVTQAAQFPMKPDGFDELTAIMVKGDYRDLGRLEEAATTVFEGFEQLMDDLDVELYYDNIDPNRPVRNVQ